MRTINFSSLTMNAQRIDLEVTFDGASYPLFFEFDRRVEVSEGDLALALSTLCGQKFEVIQLEFSVPADTLDVIRRFTGSEVEVFGTTPSTSSSTKGRSGNLLSFSGGFDSMAADALMPEVTHRVSIDFGGWFERETEFFQRFDSLIVRTNFRRIPTQGNSLALNHWGYMAVGAILTSRHFGAKYHTFGSILGQSFVRESVGPGRLAPLEATGLVDAPYVNGLTEIGTTKVMLLRYPELVSDSLRSLAGEGDKKQFLKYALTEVVEVEIESGADIPPVPTHWEKKIQFNTGHAEAMGALYAISKGRRSVIEPLFKSIPPSAVELGETVDFGFMEKFNFDQSQFLADELWGDFCDKLLRFGFKPYTENDWDNAKVVRDYLRKAIK